MTKHYSKYFNEYVSDWVTLGAFIDPVSEDTNFIIDVDKLERLNEYPELGEFLDDIASLVALENKRTPRYYRDGSAVAGASNGE